MKEKVYFIPVKDSLNDESLCLQLKDLLENEGLLEFVDENDFVPIKTHFGEKKGLGVVRPAYLKMIGDAIKSKKGRPFLTETSTLYKGRRTNAIDHLELVSDYGFGVENTGLPTIMCDGLVGDEEVEVGIKGQIYDRVKISALLERVQALVMVSHFTGHLAAGFGATLKNMGMGLASRKGKMIQHSTAKPKVKAKLCTKCEECIKWCPADAISMEEKGAVINKSICIGCGQCLAVCRFDAVGYNWGATYEDLQKKVVEHAMGVSSIMNGKTLYLNFLTRITKDCDCMNSFEVIAPDVGILVSKDPVAIDAASIDLVEERAGKKLSEMSYDIPYRFQILYADELGFGNSDYEIITFGG